MNDGCGRHFKNSFMLIFFTTLFYELKIPFEYNFFCSNHGNNPCDLAASHIKRKINTYQRDNEIILSNPIEISECVNLMNNHICYEGPTQVEQNLKVNTFNGLTKFHKFQLSSVILKNGDFVKTIHHINAFKFSKNIGYDKQYRIQQSDLDKVNLYLNEINFFS